jgi:transposase
VELRLGRPARRREIPARASVVLGREFEAAKQRLGLPEDAPVRSCYEAGRDGFWLHRCLTSMGVENVVVESSSIEVDRRRRRAKTDRLDAGKLLAMLLRWHRGDDGVWRVVNVPGVEDEDARQMHRELDELRQEQTAHGNRIQGLLASCGVTVTVDRRFPERLEELRQWDGSPLPPELCRRLLREFERMQLANQQIRALEKERVQRIRNEENDPQIGQVRQLMRLRGIGAGSAWLYVREVFGWRKIKNRRQLGGLVGLTPTPYNSGSQERDQGISKAGNRRMRAMAVEIAWGWLKFQPESQLTQWYFRRFGKGSKRQRKIGIVALARKLLVKLWKYLTTGVPPEGARVGDWQKKIGYTPSLS